MHGILHFRLLQQHTTHNKQQMCIQVRKEKESVFLVSVSFLLYLDSIGCGCFKAGHHYRLYQLISFLLIPKSPTINFYYSQFCNLFLYLFIDEKRRKDFHGFRFQHLLLLQKLSHPVLFHLRLRLRDLRSTPHSAKIKINLLLYLDVDHLIWAELFAVGSKNAAPFSQLVEVSALLISISAVGLKFSIEQTSIEYMEESRFICKLCSRKFPCGKSLGGHVRSHGIAISGENRAQFEEGKVEFLSQLNCSKSGNASSSYVLRENPKKTWRAVDALPPLQQEKVCVCKQCGKGFQSMKALCGHMACHSEKDKERGANNVHYSWTIENQKVVSDTQSETEEAEKEGTTLRATTRFSKSRRCKRVAEDYSYSPMALAINGFSSVSEVDGHEQEEMAKCLMMLKRDSLSMFGLNSVVESSDNNSVVMETTKSSSIEMMKVRRVDCSALNKCAKGEASKMEDSDSDSGYFLDECAKGESEVSVDWFRRNGGLSDEKRSQVSLRPIKKCGNVYDDNVDDEDGMGSKWGGIESRKRNKYGSEDQVFWNESSRMMKNGDANKKSKYECVTCGKNFKSYQALGGHKPCHKRSSAYGKSGENSPDAAVYYKSNSKFIESSRKRKESDAKRSSHFADKKSKNKKNKVHACPFCDRVFKNGQALGGHKRSHFLTGHEESSSRSVVEKHDLLDLNLPAPEADEAEGGDHFLSW